MDANFFRLLRRPLHGLCSTGLSSLLPAIQRPLQLKDPVQVDSLGLVLHQPGDVFGGALSVFYPVADDGA